MAFLRLFRTMRVARVSTRSTQEGRSIAVRRLRARLTAAKVVNKSNNCN